MTLLHHVIVLLLGLNKQYAMVIHQLILFWLLYINSVFAVLDLIQLEYVCFSHSTFK